MGGAERTPLVPVPPMRAVDARRLLSPPWTPPMLAPAIGRACRARALGVPVRLVVPRQTLGLRLARALHAVTGPTGPLLAAAGARPELRALPLGATVVVDPTQLDDEGWTHLETLADDGDVWLVVASEPTATLPAALEERLAAVVVEVPPLARRQLELPALSAAILHTFARRAGREAPTLSANARRLLATHPWPGDVLELEALLARALATTEAPTIEPAHLGLGPDASDSDVAAPSEDTQPVDPRVEVLLAELSHEILNPLATVKMFVGHVPNLLDDPEARAQLGGRAEEAIDRVDGLLRNVLEFARLGVPRREPVEVGALLDRLLAEVAPELAERAVRVKRSGTPTIACLGDPAQLEYGLRNLLVGVLRELPARDEFAVETGQNGVVGVRFAAGDVAASRLRAMVAPDGERALGDPTLLPLAFTLARAVIERNGGSLAVQEESDGPTTLVVRLPTVATG